MTKKTKTWIAVNITENGKNYAYAFHVLGYDNLAAKFKDIRGLLSANICATKKDAADLVTCWNECYKANGEYLFDGTF